MPRRSPRRRLRCSCRRRAGTAPSARERSSGSATSSCSGCCRGSAASRPGSTWSWRGCGCCRDRPCGTDRSAGASARRRRPCRYRCRSGRARRTTSSPAAGAARSNAIRSIQKWVSSTPRCQSCSGDETDVRRRGWNAITLSTAAAIDPSARSSPTLAGRSTNSARRSRCRTFASLNAGSATVGPVSVRDSRRLEQLFG